MTETLKILIFNWRCWFNPVMGGAEVFTHEVSDRWVKKGHEVTLFTSNFKNGQKKIEDNGITIFRDGGKYSVYWKAKKKYKNKFSKEKYDIIIDEINTRPFLTPKFVNKGEKIVALIHQLAREYWFYETSFPINYLGRYFFEERWLNNYKEIPTITVSESTKKDLIDLNFKKVFIVGEGLNFKPSESFLKKQPTPVVVFAGRLKRAKRPDHAIKAFKIVQEKIPEAELWIIGDGPFKNELIKKSCENIKFFGFLSNLERRKLIGKAWVLVNPSVREGFGLNIIEANALRVPCIAYNVHGLRDAIIEGKTGLLVKSGDVNSFAIEIIRILQDNALRKKLSNQALNYSKVFSWDKVAEKFMKIITQI